ncbi:hypothetical protein [Flagellimonas allohymeniacidonis]|uniref:Uncharacterized protein n=1 Tax=Flagellimonas allohymeniacidonis TaxID=2517819 RepID=A0A4Q8QGC1_9FLAO|nr:hypothetical protein [Allomuricauda hymeniacidonis]TAI47409.1 hypothetical protein EW142_12105 [Allomuricauda hymeniacidonis]
MKYLGMRYFLVLFFLLFFCLGHSQKRESIIHFRNGEQKKCLATMRKGKIIVFHENGKKEKLDHRTVSKIEYGSVWGTGIFYYKIQKGYSGVMLIELIKAGAVNLYGVYIHQTSFDGVSSGGNMLYYLGKENEGTLTNFERPQQYGQTWFETYAKEFFADCGPVLQKIERKEFRRLDLPEIAEYYNSTCGN